MTSSNDFPTHGDNFTTLGYHIFNRKADGVNPAGQTVSKHSELPEGDFSITEYCWGETSLWFIDADEFDADERQLAFELAKLKGGAKVSDDELDIPEGVINEIIADLRILSGQVLWRVTGEWANKGRTGKIDDIVSARTATEAIEIAWVTENDRDLRDIRAEWLCPVESVKKAEAPE